MSPKGFDPSVLAAWLWWRPSLKAFGAHLRLPSPREVIILCCVLVTLHTVATVARRHIATRPPRRWNLPVRTASAIPYGVPPPGFQAVAPDGRPYTQDSLPSDGPALVAFLTYRCGACDRRHGPGGVAPPTPTSASCGPLRRTGPSNPSRSETGSPQESPRPVRLDPTGVGLSWIGQRPAFPYSRSSTRPLHLGLTGSPRRPVRATLSPGTAPRPQTPPTRVGPQAPRPA